MVSFCEQSLGVVLNLSNVNTVYFVRNNSLKKGFLLVHLYHWNGHVVSD